MIAGEIEAIFAGLGVEDGHVDIDGVLGAFKRLKSIATEADLPSLVAAIQSPRNNFWTRELLADPISQLGGPAYLELLFEAAQLGLDEGHDNDGFDTHLSPGLPTPSRKSVASNLKSYWPGLTSNTEKQLRGYSSFAVPMRTMGWLNHTFTNGQHLLLDDFRPLKNPRFRR